MIATRDIAVCVAERLVKRDFAGKSVRDLLGERDLTLMEVTAVIGRSIGLPDLKYVQFSYGLHCPVAPPAGVTVAQAAYIFFNLPPARVWVYRRR